jgi:hypothetical protein
MAAELFSVAVFWATGSSGGFVALLVVSVEVKYEAGLGVK